MHYEGLLHNHKKFNLIEKFVCVNYYTVIINIRKHLLKGKPSYCGTTALHN